MAITNDVKAFLDTRGREGGVYSRLNKGDYVQNLLHVYEIDDPYILDGLAMEESFPYDAVRRLFNVYRGLNGKLSTIVPFSEAIKNQRGTCTEHAIAGQLVAQAQQRDFYLVGGYVKAKDGISFHYYNIGRFTEGWCLVDITNPLRRGENIEPYVAPITSIDAEGLGIIVPKEWTDWRGERSYFLCKLPSEIPDDFPFR